ncbi:MAG: DUF3644 domain-containing protein [Candidatus Moranbacteria bacterium]|nr:DUF3644 domain-containing protein [Candidatus Moranbacteria bacterium]
MVTRQRKLGSVKNELIRKSIESMLSAVQIFNNPSIQFKSESFIVLSVIAWTYLLHAHYREQKIEYRYFEQKGKRRKFDTTKNGAYKYWELERCLNDIKSPIDKVTSNNLKFLIGLRHEIEHQMTTKIDDLLSARFQACCLNYNSYLKKLFPKQDGIEKYLSFSLQFSSLNEKQIDQLVDYEDLPQNISIYIQQFDQELPDEEFNDSRFSYRVLFVPKTANRKGQADKVIEFIPADSEVAKGMNKEYVLVKEKEKMKYSPSEIWKKIQKDGFKKFGAYQHTQLWRTENAKDPSKGFGTFVVKTWYWYDSWLDFVKKHCEENKSEYT